MENLFLGGIIYTSATKRSKKMSKFNAKQVAMFIASKHFKVFEYQAPAMVATHFSVDLRTARKWVQRVIESGEIVRNGRVALALV